MSMTKQQQQQHPPVNDKNNFHNYEFGGPIGTAITTCVLPVIVLLLAHWSEIGYVSFSDILPTTTTSSSSSSSNGLVQTTILQSDVLCPNCIEFLEWASSNEDSSGPLPILLVCTIGVVIWFVFQVLLERCLPGQIVDGAPIIVVATTTDGDKKQKQQQQPEKPLRLKYRINGHLCFWVTIMFMSTGYPIFENNKIVGFTSWPIWNYMYEQFASLAFVTSILCFIGSLCLYFNSYRAAGPTNNRPRILAKGGNSGHMVYDFFMGRELNPRFFNTTFDWKVFCELRPGLIGWLLFNISAAYKQIQVLGYVSNSMLLINLFHFIYVWDALYQENAILTTMDVTTDGFGFMLLFGDLCWVPFTYSLQARYLVTNDPDLSFVALFAILALHGFGYYVFRGANGQKDLFRTNPNDPKVRHLKFMQTKRGTKLLTSGWWGMARKINYTGDYIMGVSWCLLCGFNSIVPYYYAIYFAILLVHRSIRDDHMCQEKYGNDWLTYKKLVPYRFIPGVV